MGMTTRMRLAQWLGVVGMVFVLIPPAHSETITLPAGTALQVVMETTLSTKNSKEGDPFRSRLVLPLFADERQVLPVGCIIEGTVARLETPGRVKGKAEMQLRPETLTFPDGRTVPVTATVTEAQTGDKIEVDPEEGTIQASGSKEGMDARGVGTTAATSAVIGGVMAGGTGAAIGAGAVGAIALLHQLFKRGKDADLPAGSEIVLELNRPVYFETMEEVPASRPRMRDDEEPGSWGKKAGRGVEGNF